ncbi:MAG TPA: hypothetical protein VLB46_23225 [Pyrinomonadaceae bacterium]|nr:hypothetical protein [Pyrinomonadaceae bacterium]
MKQIFIRRTGNSVTFDTVNIDITQNVFFTNLDPDAPHWPALDPNGKDPDFCDDELLSAPSDNSSQCNVPEPAQGTTAVNYGCRIKGHGNERGVINVFPLLAAAAKTALTATKGQATKQPVVVGGMPPYTITNLIVNGADVPGSSTGPNQTLPIGPGVALVQSASEISIAGTPTEANTYSFTFVVDDSMGLNLQQVQYSLKVS